MMEFERETFVNDIIDHCEKYPGEIYAFRFDDETGMTLVLRSYKYQSLWNVLWDLWIDEKITSPSIGDNHIIQEVLLPGLQIIGGIAVQARIYEARIFAPAESLDIPNLDNYDPNDPDFENGGLI